ncbi:MAG: TetR/AcrR family transcriptional regulator [Anaerolineae bacterium]|nr:TetR/AcrR family transcriptional regulator [Anaerolineales bacterium]MCQ3976209.1 TetR/AcrR family transcriptional regulator [Anaerolineae bacterium]
MNLEKKSAKVVQGEATVQTLTAVARRLFSERGYHDVSTEEIVQAAQVTRGALYHHFSGKSDLFLAVFEAVQGEISQRIEQAAEAASEGWDAFLAGCRAFLETCLDPQIQRIVFIDAPAVLGWDSWRRVDTTYGLMSLKAGLTDLIHAGLIKPQPLDALAHLLSGAMNEAALWITHAENPPQALEEAMTTLEILLQGLKTEKV